MALLFMDSFDHYLTGDIYKKWTAMVGTLATASIIAPDIANPGGPGQYLGLSGTTNSSNSTTYIYKSFTAAQTIICGGWFRAATLTNTWAGSGANDYRLFGVLDSGTVQVEVRCNNDGTLKVMRNGTLLATASVANAINVNTWYHIELKTKIDPSTGTYELRVNGVNVASGTGANTRASSNSSANQFALITKTVQNGNASVDTLYAKGVYVLDDSGSVANDFLGMVRVTCLRPSKKGNYSDWTPTFGDNLGGIEDNVIDGDYSFNMSGSAGQIDTFEMQDCPAASGTVYGIQHVIGARQDPGAARTIAALQRSSSTDYAGTTQSLSALYQFLLDIRTLNPATSAGYTVSEVNAMEAGYKLVS